MVSIGLLLVVGLGLGMFLARGRLRYADDYPHCGRCGYIVLNLPTVICPECGSDLSKVGVVSGSPKRVVPALVWMILGALAAYGAASTLAGVLWDRLDLWNRSPATIVKTETTWETGWCFPSSGAYRMLRLSYTQVALGSQVTNEEFRWLVELPDHHTVSLDDGLRFDLTKPACEYTNRQGVVVRHSGRPTRELLEAWMRERGVKSDTRDVQNELDAVWKECQPTLQGSSTGRITPPKHVRSAFFSGDISGGPGRLYFRVPPPFWYGCVPHALAVIVVAFAILTIWLGRRHSQKSLFSGELSRNA